MNLNQGSFELDQSNLIRMNRSDLKTKKEKKSSHQFEYNQCHLNHNPTSLGEIVPNNMRTAGMRNNQRDLM